MDVKDLLFIGTYGHVAAIEKDTGQEAWRTSLPGTGYRLVSLLVEDGTLFAGSRGHVYALNPQDGQVLWRNTLPSLGLDHVFMTTTQSSSSQEFVTAVARSAHDSTQ